MSGGMYGGSPVLDQHRRLSRFRQTPSSRESLQRMIDRIAREDLQGAATYAMQNDAEARAHVGRLEDLVVGDEGPQLESATGDGYYDDLINSEWPRYFGDVGPGTMDCRGMVPGTHLLRSQVNASCVSGRNGWAGVGTDAEADDSVRRENDPAGSVQLFDGVRIMNPSGGLDTDSRIAGVELGAYGQFLGLHVAGWSHGGMYLGLETRFIDASAGPVGYVPNPMATELDLIAPPPALAAALLPMAQLSAVINTVVDAAIREANLKDYLKPGSPTDEMLDSIGSGNPLAEGFRINGRGELEIGMVNTGLMVVREGDEIVSGTSQYPQQAIEPWIRSQLQRVSSSLGMTYEIASGDYRGMTFNGARLAMQLTGRRIAVVQSALERMFLRPVFTRVFVPWLIARGDLKASRLPIGWDRPTVTHPEMPDPDPQKTQVRILTQTKTGVTLDRDIAAMRGESLDEYRGHVLEQAAFYESAGVANPMGAAVMVVPESGQDQPQPLPGERAGGDEAGGGAPLDGASDPDNLNDVNRSGGQP
ncbi:MAG: phage portal protein [Planctomycetota bacterium]